MMRIVRRQALIVLLLPWVLALATQAAVAHAEDPQAYLESLDVRLVSLDVTVSGDGDEPVTGLTAEDFEVLDEGQPVVITHFGAPTSVPPEEPSEARATDLRVVLFLDDSELLPAQRAAVFVVLQEQLDALLTVAREVMLVRRGETAQVEQAFTSSREKLATTLDRLLQQSAPTAQQRGVATFATWA